MSYEHPCILGTAVVTLDKAALWTDGRTFQKAIDNVDCGWTVYRRGMYHRPKTIIGQRRFTMTY